MAKVLIPKVPVERVLTLEERWRASETCREALERAADLGSEISTWCEYWRDVWEERSAIIEFCGGQPRAEAERLAEVCVRREHARQTEEPGGDR